MADDTDKSTASIESLEVSLGPVKAKASLANVLFSRRKARNRIEMGLADAIVEKIKTREALTELELFFFASVFEKELKRTARAEAVIARAAELFPSVTHQMKALPPPSDPKGTSEEFAARVLRHAEDVSDEGVRELYARIIAGEVARPGTFSLRTLSVLRDLEGDTAQKFEAATTLMLCGRYLPYQLNPRLYELVNITGSDLRKFQESGLLIESAPLRAGKAVIPLPDGVGAVQNNATLLVVRIGDLLIHDGMDSSSPPDDEYEINIPALELTTAGRELATIPARRPDLVILRALAAWIAQCTRRNQCRVKVSWCSADGSADEQDFDPPVELPDP